MPLLLSLYILHHFPIHPIIHPTELALDMNVFTNTTNQPIFYTQICLPSKRYMLQSNANIYKIPTHTHTHTCRKSVYLDFHLDVDVNISAPFSYSGIIAVQVLLLIHTIWIHSCPSWRYAFSEKNREDWGHTCIHTVLFCLTRLGILLATNNRIDSISLLSQIVSKKQSNNAIILTNNWAKLGKLKYLVAKYIIIQGLFWIL